MKKLRLMALMLSALVLVSCGGDKKKADRSNSEDAQEQEQVAKSQLSGVAVMFDGDEKWSMIDTKGNVLFRDKFEGSISSAYNGVFSVLDYDDWTYSLYNVNDVDKPIAGCEGLTGAGAFISEKIAPVVGKDEPIRIIDTEGKTVCTLDKDVTLCDVAYYDGMLLARTSSGYGALDTHGRWVVKPKYDIISRFHDGYALGSRNGIYYLLGKDSSKHTIDEPESFGDGYFVSDGEYLVKNGRFYTIMSIDGESTMWLDRDVVGVDDFNKEYVVYRTDKNGWFRAGMMTRDYEQKIKPVYDTLLMLADGKLYLASQNGDYYLLNADGDIFKDLDDYYYIEVSPNDNYMVASTLNDKVQFLDLEGERIEHDPIISIEQSTALSFPITTSWYVDEYDEFGEYGLEDFIEEVEFDQYPASEDCAVEVLDIQDIEDFEIIPEYEKEEDVKSQKDIVEAYVPIGSDCFDEDYFDSYSSAKDDVIVEASEAVAEDDTVFVSVEQMPTYPGGDAALLKWISEHIKYPAVAAENNIQGRVTIQFVVEKDGSIGEVKVVRGKDPDLDKEVVRVVKSIKTKFEPGRMNGHTVRVWYTLPINFKLPN